MFFNHKKYYLNPDTLTYEEIRKNKVSGILKFASITIFFVVLAFVSGFLFNQEFGSVESRLLEAKIDSLSQRMFLLLDRGTEYSRILETKIFSNDNNYRLILQLDTMPYSMRQAGWGGSAAVNEMVQKENLTYQLSEMVTSLNHQLQLQSQSFSALYSRALQHAAENTHLPAIQPVAKEDLVMIGSYFGIRVDPFLAVERQHQGLDFVAAPGKKVYATGDGIVTFVSYSRTGYGNEIVIDHRFGFSTRYGHLGSIIVKEGDQVKRGQVIGTVGATGRATGPHLHYEVLYCNQPVNPSFYFDTTLTSEEFAQITNQINENIH